MGTIWRCYLIFCSTKCTENSTAKSVEWVKFLRRTCTQMTYNGKVYIRFRVTIHSTRWSKNKMCKFSWWLILTYKHGFENGTGRNPGLRAESWFGKLIATSKPWRGLRSCNSSAGHRLTLSFDSLALFWLILRRGCFKKQRSTKSKKNIMVKLYFVLKHTTADEQSCFVPPSL
jgi:hypothetical protein